MQNPVQVNLDLKWQGATENKYVASCPFHSTGCNFVTTFPHPDWIEFIASHLVSCHKDFRTDILSEIRLTPFDPSTQVFMPKPDNTFIEKEEPVAFRAARSRIKEKSTFLSGINYQMLNEISL